MRVGFAPTTPRAETTPRRRARAPRCVARRASARRSAPRRLRRADPRCWARRQQCRDGGRRGLLPREARGPAAPVRRTDHPGARRLLPDGYRPWPWPNPPVQRRRPRGRARHLLTGRAVAADQVAAERGRLDAVFAGLLFMAGMRRSEVSALRWLDVVDTTDGDGVLITVRRSKTNQEGETNDVRFVKGGVARATQSPEPRPRGTVVGTDDRPAVYGRGAGRRHREPSDRSLRPRRAGIEVDEPGCVDYRRDARRQLEDQPHGGALFRWRDCGTRCCRTVPLSRCCPPESTFHFRRIPCSTSAGIRRGDDIRLVAADASDGERPHAVPGRESTSSAGSPSTNRREKRTGRPMPPNRSAES